MYLEGMTVPVESYTKANSRLAYRLDPDGSEGMTVPVELPIKTTLELPTGLTLEDPRFTELIPMNPRG